MRQVLAERARAQLAAELGTPIARLPISVGVDGLVGSAVDGPVGLLVAVHVDSPNGHAALDRGLPDRGRSPRAGPVSTRRGRPTLTLST